MRQGGLVAKRNSFVVLLLLLHVVLERTHGATRAHTHSGGRALLLEGGNSDVKSGGVFRAEQRASERRARAAAVAVTEWEKLMTARTFVDATRCRRRHDTIPSDDMKSKHPTSPS